MQMRNIAHTTSFFLYNILPVSAVSCFPFAVWRLAPSLLFHIFQVVQRAKSGLPPSVIVRQRLKLQKMKVEKLWKKCRLKLLRSTANTASLESNAGPFQWSLSSSKWSPSWWPRWWQSVLWCFPRAIVMVANGLWNALSSSHRVPPLPLCSASAPWQHDFATELDIQKIQRYLWSSFWDTHVPCLRDIAHAVCIPLHHRQLITNMTTRLKWIMPIRQRYSTPAHW